MSDEIAVAAIAAAASILSALVGGRAVHEARRAVRNTEPISNGFAKGVRTSLDSINAHLDDVHKDVREVRQALLDHLNNHP